MRLGIAYSSRNAVENTEATLDAWRASKHSDTYDFHWVDGSDDPVAIGFLNSQGPTVTSVYRNITGGADAAIAYKLTLLLKHPRKYTHMGLMENDVLLDPDWFEPTMALFERGKSHGLDVGAVSTRSYVDRVLVQRDGYAAMHNCGAGMVIFTREAAQLVLRTFRTHWWQDNVKLFAHLSGIDLRTYAAFKGNEQWVTTDWGFEAQLARIGLASLALTPARAQMIGQKIPLEQQGLTLTTQSGIGTVLDGTHEIAFQTYRDNLKALRWDELKYTRPDLLHRDGAGMLFFPHQLGYLAEGATWQGTLGLIWNQGFGPFTYRAGKDGASLSLRASGICSFLVAGGPAGAGVTIRDIRSGFKAEPKLAAESGMVTVSVPGSPVPRELTLQMEEGALFCGIHCGDEQMINPAYRFTWGDLPEAT